MPGDRTPLLTKFKSVQKKLLGILVLGLCGITRNKLETKEIKQGFSLYDRRKTAPALETYSGCW